jgi:hypothetical protein
MEERRRGKGLRRARRIASRASYRDSGAFCTVMRAATNSHCGKSDKRGGVTPPLSFSTSGPLNITRSNPGMATAWLVPSDEFIGFPFGAEATLLVPKVSVLRFARLSKHSDALFFFWPSL